MKNHKGSPFTFDLLKNNLKKLMLEDEESNHQSTPDQSKENIFESEKYQKIIKQ